MNKITQADRDAARNLKRKAASARRKKLLASAEKRLAAQKEATKRWRAANPEKVAAQQARYYAKKAAKYTELAAEAKKSAIIYAHYEEGQLASQTHPYPTDPKATAQDNAFWEGFWKERGLVMKPQNADEGAPKPPDVVDNG